MTITKITYISFSLLLTLAVKAQKKQPQNMFESDVIKGQYKNPDNISLQTSAVLRSMLTVDPKRRLTAQELLDTYFPRQISPKTKCKKSKKTMRQNGNL